MPDSLRTYLAPPDVLDRGKAVLDLQHRSRFVSASQTLTLVLHHGSVTCGSKLRESRDHNGLNLPGLSNLLCKVHPFRQARPTAAPGFLFLGGFLSELEWVLNAQRFDVLSKFSRELVSFSTVRL